MKVADPSLRQPQGNICGFGRCNLCETNPQGIHGNAEGDQGSGSDDCSLIVQSSYFRIIGLPILVNHFLLINMRGYMWRNLMLAGISGARAQRDCEPLNDVDIRLGYG